MGVLYDLPKKSQSPMHGIRLRKRILQFFNQNLHLSKGKYHAKSGKLVKKMEEKLPHSVSTYEVEMDKLLIGRYQGKRKKVVFTSLVW